MYKTSSEVLFQELYTVYENQLAAVSTVAMCVCVCMYSTVKYAEHLMASTQTAPPPPHTNVISPNIKSRLRAPMKKYHCFICMDVSVFLRFEWMFWKWMSSPKKSPLKKSFIYVMY